MDLSSEVSNLISGLNFSPTTGCDGELGVLHITKQQYANCQRVVSRSVLNNDYIPARPTLGPTHSGRRTCITTMLGYDHTEIIRCFSVVGVLQRRLTLDASVGLCRQIFVRCHSTLCHLRHNASYGHTKWLCSQLHCYRVVGFINLPCGLSLQIRLSIKFDIRLVANSSSEKEVCGCDVIIFPLFQ